MTIWHVVGFAALVLFFRVRGSGFYGAMFFALPGIAAAHVGWYAVPAYKTHHALIEQLRPVDASAAYVATVRKILTDPQFEHIESGSIKRAKTKKGSRLRVNYEVLVPLYSGATLSIVFDELVGKTPAEALALR